MKSASDLQRMVLDELQWEPSLNAGEIGVSVNNGVVTLTGHVESYTAKRSAEKATKRVAGVRGVANDLVVQLPSTAVRDDTDIAQAAVTALQWNTSVPDDRVKVSVSNGWITLEGMVEWQYQKDAASKAVRNLTGVHGVTNRITLKPHANVTQVKEKIEAAFRRSADIDSKHVRVVVEGDRVILRGDVRSWKEYEDAEWAAWSAPGVTDVENRLVVEDEMAAFV